MSDEEPKLSDMEASAMKLMANVVVVSLVVVVIGLCVGSVLYVWSWVFSLLG